MRIWITNQTNKTKLFLLHLIPLVGMIAAIAVCVCIEYRCSRWSNISDREGLVYDKETKIVYYNQNKNPYYSENGKMCRYKENKIQEIK